MSGDAAGPKGGNARSLEVEVTCHDPDGIATCRNESAETMAMEACVTAEPIAPELRSHVAGFLNLCFARSVLEENLDRALRRSTGITLAQHAVLYRLSLTPDGRLRMAGLAEMLLTSKSGCSRLVDRMATSGLVERESSHADRRLVFAVLTSKGRSALIRSTPIFLAGVTSAFGEHLDAEDHEALRQILQKLLTAHDVWDVRRCEPPPV